MKNAFSKLAIVALALLAVALTACSKDDDNNPGGQGTGIGSGTGSAGQYTFTANGTTYYYGYNLYDGEVIPGMSFWQIGSAWESSMMGTDYIALTVMGYSKQMTYSEIAEWQWGKIDVNGIDLEIYVEDFDYETAKPGDKLTLFGFEARPGVRVPWPRLQYTDIKNVKEDYYYWTATGSDAVTFVSYDDDVLTVNVGYLAFLPEREYEELPEQFVIKGNISCRLD